MTQIDGPAVEPLKGNINKFTTKSAVNALKKKYDN